MDNTRNNLVAKHAKTFNLAHKHTDRKKEHKKGYTKYPKAKYYLNVLINSIFK